VVAVSLHLDSIQGKSAGMASASSNQFLPEGMTLEQWEDNMIREALRRANGNKSQAARLLGLSRNALRYRLGKLGVPDEAE
jgi:DNA-binding NtrC family response regulator